MDEESIRRYIGAFEGVDVEIASKERGAPEIAWGDTFFIHDPDRNLEGPRRFPFATIVTKDYGDFDNASELDRPGVFRLNVGVSKKTFQSLFAGGGTNEYTALDTLMPHPVYGSNHWVCVLNPSDETFESMKPLIDEAYAIAAGRNRNRGNRG
jgi:uncharacterized protein DUF6194